MVRPLLVLHEASVLTWRAADIMYDTLSVRETLLFYTKARWQKPPAQHAEPPVLTWPPWDAQLRLPAQPAANTHARVEALMARLGLAYAADVPIGNALRPGISGGQRKRLSIGACPMRRAAAMSALSMHSCSAGMELIDNPALLFLGACTVGLIFDPGLA